MMATYLLVLGAAFTRAGITNVIFINEVSWVVSTPRFPVPASLHLLALQLKPSLLGLRATERTIFTPSFLVSIQVTRRGRKELDFYR